MAGCGKGDEGCGLTLELASSWPWPLLAEGLGLSLRLLCLLLAGASRDGPPVSLSLCLWESLARSWFSPALNVPRT